MNPTQREQVRKALEKAIEVVGSEKALGEACNVTQAAISMAKFRGNVSAKLAIAIESATGGEIPRWQLRPDLWDAPRHFPTPGGAAESEALA